MNSEGCHLLCSKCLAEKHLQNDPSLIDVKDFPQLQHTLELIVKDRLEIASANIALSKKEVHEVMSKALHRIEDAMRKLLNEFKTSLQKLLVEMCLLDSYEKYQELKDLLAFLRGNKEEKKTKMQQDSFINELIDRISRTQMQFSPARLDQRCINKHIDKFQDAQAVLLKKLINNIHNDKEALRKNVGKSEKIKAPELYETTHYGGCKPQALEVIPSLGLIAMGGREGEISLWDMKSFEHKQTQKVHHHWIEDMAYSSSRKLLFVTSIDVAIQAFGINENGFDISQKYVMRGHKRSAKGLLVLEDKGLLISSGGDYGIKVWDLKTLTLNKIISTGNDKNLGTQIVYIPKDDLIGVGFGGGKVKFFELGTGKKKFSILANRNGAWDALIYCPKRQILIAGVSKKVIKIWEVEETKIERAREIIYDGEYPDSFAYIEKEGWIVIPSGSNQLLIFSCETCKMLFTIDLPLENAGGVTYLAFSNKIVVTDSYSNKFCVVSLF